MARSFRLVDEGGECYDGDKGDCQRRRGYESAIRTDGVSKWELLLFGWLFSSDTLFFFSITGETNSSLVFAVVWWEESD